MGDQGARCSALRGGSGEGRVVIYGSFLKGWVSVVCFVTVVCLVGVV